MRRIYNNHTKVTKYRKLIYNIFQTDMCVMIDLELQTTVMKNQKTGNCKKSLTLLITVTLMTFNIYLTILHFFLSMFYNLQKTLR
jgi:hypothetical protein